MRYSLLFLVLFGTVLMINHNVNAQTTGPQPEHFQNRIVDSIFSKTLNESLTFG